MKHLNEEYDAEFRELANKMLVRLMSDAKAAGVCPTCALIHTSALFTANLLLRENAVVAGGFTEDAESILEALTAAALTFAEELYSTSDPQEVDEVSSAVRHVH